MCSAFERAIGEEEGTKQKNRSSAPRERRRVEAH
jgi:hypothetical protein